jgi:4-hydroxybenzoate polyprenyltransferase
MHLTKLATETTAKNRIQGIRGIARWITGIRFDEVAALQATPLIGATFSIHALAADHLLVAALLMAGNICLVAHVFLLNDWAGISGDLKDPARAERTFQARGLTRQEVGYLAFASLVAGLLLFGAVNMTVLVVAVSIAIASGLYSYPRFHAKGAPLWSSALHFVGGCLHFLLGFAAFRSIDETALIISCFFGMVFTAGHFMHEVRDYDIDLINGINTNSVAFGKARGFTAGLVLFICSYGLLSTLAALRVVPLPLVFVAAFIPIHLSASWLALRAGLTPRSLYRLQRIYRFLFAIIGVAIIAAQVFG